MNAPMLRFQEFRQTWDSELLINVAKLINGRAYKKDEFQNEGKYTVLRVGNFFTSDTWYYSDLELDKDKYADTGDLLYAWSASFGPKIWGGEKVIYHYHIWKVKINEEKITRDFLYSWFNYDASKLLSQKNGSTMVHITKNNMENRIIYIPNISEQKKIGAFFKTIEKKIQLQQEKIDLLQEQKTGFLQKMFPKIGELKPEIRFNGFNDEWKQRKLEEVTNRVRGNDGRMDLPTLTISASQGWLDQKERFSGNIAGKEQKNYTLLKKGQLSYNHGNSKLAKYGVVFELDTYEEALVPRVYHSFETNDLANSKFIQYMFETKRTDKELGKLISSGARMDGLLNINYDEFMGIRVLIPNIEEQKKIAEFFIRLERKINIEKDKMNELEKQKQAFMQQMFI